MMKKFRNIAIATILVFMLVGFLPVGNTFAASKIKMSKCKVSISYTNCVYTGYAKKPKVKVKYNGKTIPAKNNYYVKYTNSKGPGPAKVKVVGKGAFTGSVTKNYNVNVGKVTGLKAVYTGAYTDDPAGTIKVTWTKSKKCSSYSIVVNKDDQSFGSYTTTSTNYTIKDLGAAGKFDITVYAVAGKKYVKSVPVKTSVNTGMLNQTVNVSNASVTKSIGEPAFNIGATAKTALTYKSSNTGIATVDAKGNVTMKGVGSVTITATAAQTAQYYGVSKAVTVTVNNPQTPVASVKSPGYRRMDVSWNQITGAQGYNIRETNSSGKTSTTVIKSPTQIATSFYDKTKGSAYKYEVQAYTVVGGKTFVSGWSKIVSATAAGTNVGEAATGDKGTSGNTPGDQSGREVRVRAWAYSSTASSYKHITHVARFKDPAMAEAAASAVEKACANNNIGYDQPNRKTVLKYAEVHGWDPSQITEKCDCSCVTLVELGVNCAYKKTVVSGFNASTTMTTKIKALPNMFTLYTDSKYLTTDAYLQRGDIIYSESGNHACMVL